MSEQSLTHYLPYFTERRRGALLAVCGASVAWDEHSPEPTCPQCAAWIDADEKEAAALAAKWDREDAAKRAAAQGVSR